jgi:folate-binding protein YgfZ
MYLIEDLSKFYPLENNLHLLNAVDFKKGCYVGQELTARMKLRNKIPRTILPFILNLKNNETIDTKEILENETVVGEIIFQKNKYVFGHITFRKLSGPLSLDMHFSLNGHELEINHQNWLTF